MRATIIAMVLAVLFLGADPGLLAAAAPSTHAAAKVAAPPVKVDINAASRDELKNVPGIGPKIAQAIVDLRSKKGAFSRLEDLLEVRGIGEKKLRILQGYLILPAPAAPASAAAPPQPAVMK